MREYHSVYCAVTGAPVFYEDLLNDYGLRLLYCLFLPEDPNETVERYLLCVSGPSDRLSGGGFCDTLNDYYERRGSSARCWSYSCVGHYYDGV